MDISITDYRIRIVVVAPQGRFDAFNAPAMRERLDSLVAEGTLNFVINLAQTPFIDSAGMAVLVSLLKRARHAGGDVKLIWPEQEAARRILSLTRFDRVFDMASTVEAAVASFKLSVQNLELYPTE
jgi:anti-anti-sigma factor